MSLPHFIHDSLEDILAEWEPEAGAAPGGAGAAGRRQHFGKLLYAVAAEMKRSKAGWTASARPANAPLFRAAASPESRVIGEYASLRASVMRQWRARQPAPSAADLDDLVHFNEAMDRSLAELTATFAPAESPPQALFLGVLNHELRNSVASIQMSAQVLTHRAAAASPEAKAAQRILGSCAHLRHTLDALSDFTDVPLGRHLEIAAAPADLGVLCKQVLDAFARGDAGHRVRLEASGDLVGEWDGARLGEAIGSLLAHAARFAPRGSTVSIAVDGEAEHEVKVAVHGDGSPIDAPTLRTIFDPQARLESDNATYAGLGLGLFIVRKIVDAHGGSVTVDAAAGGGTTFTIALPRKG